MVLLPDYPSGAHSGRIRPAPASGNHPPGGSRFFWTMRKSSQTFVYASVIKGWGDCPASCPPAVTSSRSVSARPQETDFTSPAVKLLYIARLSRLGSSLAFSHSCRRATEGSATVQAEICNWLSTLRKTSQRRSKCTDFWAKHPKAV